MATTPRAISLYRRILREHRRKLPYEMRMLGDKYVGEEFRRHRGEEEGGSFLPKFFAEWERYVSMLEQQTPQTGFGAPLEASRHGELNDEQKAMLAQLRRETAEAMNRNG